MIVICCDLCESPIKDKGYYPFMLAQGWHYQPPDGRPRLVKRGKIYSALLCSRCPRRVQSVLTKERSMQPASGQWDQPATADGSKQCSHN